jgi:hypothetical protein
VRGVDSRLGRAGVAEAAHHARLPIRRVDGAPSDGEDRVHGERHVRARQRGPRRPGHLLTGGEDLGMLVPPRPPAADTAGGGRDDRRAQPHAVVGAHRGEKRDSTIHQRPGIAFQSPARARVVAGLGECQHVQLRNERMTDPRREAPRDTFAPRVQPDHEHARVHRRRAHRFSSGPCEERAARDRASPGRARVPFSAPISAPICPARDPLSAPRAASSTVIRSSPGGRGRRCSSRS